MRLLLWLCSALLAPQSWAGTLRAMLLLNSEQADGGFHAFDHFAVPYINRRGFSISGDPDSPYTLESVLCERNLQDASVRLSNIQECVNAAANGTDLQGKIVGNFDAIVVGTSSGNADVQAAAEAVRIPNLHCAGGNPAMWTAMTPHAFGLHLPFTTYSQGPIRQAASLGVRTLFVIRDSDWGFPKTSAVASMEWAAEAGLRVIGPTVAWCNRWVHKTGTCRVVKSACRCGDQSEWDMLGYKFQVESRPSFYEVSESKVVEPGFNSRGPVISPALLAYVRAIIQDIRSQGADPEMMVNWLGAARSGLLAAREEHLDFKYYFGAPNLPGEAWNAYDSVYPNGTTALDKVDAMYNVGGGQWHPSMSFSDPIFGNSTHAVDLHRRQMGGDPSYAGAACATAAVALAFGLEKYGSPLSTLDAEGRRAVIRQSVGSINDETLFGNLRFNRFNQNNGRLPVSWQVVEDGSTATVLPVGAAESITRFPSPSWEARYGCPAGTAGASPSNLLVSTECLACPEGRFSSGKGQGLAIEDCEECPAGLGTMPGTTGASVCGQCPAGRVQNGLQDKGVCNVCPEGSFRGALDEGSTCILCPKGRYADVTGLGECRACPLRTHQPDQGQRFCVCDIGAYKDPTDNATLGVTKACLSCETVLPGSVTLYPGSKHQSSCVCPEGTFWSKASPNSMATCKACLEGLACLGGRAQGDAGSNHQPPQQKAGFAASAPAFPGADPEYVVKCKTVEQCPGGLALGECHPNGDGRACALCIEDTYFDGNICKKCGLAPGGYGLPIILLVVACSAVLAVLFASTARRNSPYKELKMTVVITVTLGASFVQTLGAFCAIDISWVEPIQYLSTLLGFFTLSMDMLRPGCLSKLREPFVEYLASALLYPAFAILLLLGLLLIGCAKRRPTSRAITVDKVLNVEGMVLGAVYISMTSVAFLPFQCAANPDGSASLQSFPSIQCWEASSDHIWFLVVSIFLFLGVVVGYFAMVLYAVFSYPRRVARLGASSFIQRYFFLFSRFHTKDYFFALVFTSKSFMIGMIPAAFVKFPEVQIVVMYSVISLYSLLVGIYWPWRSLAGNVLDVGFAWVQGNILIIGSLLADVLRDTLIVQTFLALATAGATLAFATIMAYGIGRFLYRPKRYYAFLSHHKADASMLCRWLKTLLMDQGSGRVFYDSDDVVKLDLIVDTIATDLSNMVVVLTSGTLSRIWCAAEIATAYRSGVKTILVACNDFQGMAVVEECASQFTEEQTACLRQCGLSTEDVRGAYARLKTLPIIRLDRHGAVVEHHKDVARQVMVQCRGGASSVRTHSKERKSAGEEAYVLIAADLTSDEMGCCCRVMQRTLQRRLGEAVGAVSKDNDAEWDEQLRDAKYVVVLLSRGLLEQPWMAGFLSRAHGKEQAIEMIPVRVDPAFNFPDHRFWEELAAGETFCDEALASFGVDLETVELSYRKLFNALAMTFQMHAGLDIQNMEIALIMRRIELPSGVGLQRTGVLQYMGEFVSSRSSNSHEHSIRQTPSLDLAGLQLPACDDELFQPPASLRPVMKVRQPPACDDEVLEPPCHDSQESCEDVQVGVSGGGEGRGIQRL